MPIPLSSEDARTVARLLNALELQLAAHERASLMPGESEPPLGSWERIERARKDRREARRIRLALLNALRRETVKALGDAPPDYKVPQLPVVRRKGSHS